MELEQKFVDLGMKNLLKEIYNACAGYSIGRGVIVYESAI